MAALVSIVTRTLGRPCVADAAASVAAQTYRPLEWVVVDASGNGVDVPAAGDVPVRVVSTGAPMLRSVAGNAGFGGVSGRRLAILDDDDLLMPTFVERLSAALDAHPQAGVAYGNVRVETDRPDVAGLYAFEYSELLLLRRNLFPPNAALVDAALVRERGISFDTGLDVLEDWDFWLQASSHAPFVHVREVLAIYRLWLSGSGVWAIDAPEAPPSMRSDEATVRRRYADRRQAAEARHLELTAAARRLEAEGRVAEAARAWMAAHEHFHYDPEPVRAYARIAWSVGEVRAARATLEGALALMPNDATLKRDYASLLARLGEPAP